MKFRCPQCSQKLEGDRSFVGSEFDCPTCHHPFIIVPHETDEIPVSVPPSKPPQAPESIFENHYILQGQIARGGMGKIVSATDNKLDRSVVVKQLLDPDEDPVLVNQLIREARITARLSHPGIVPIHELGRDSQGRIYYTMKHIRGEPLDKVLEKLSAGDPATIGKCPFERLLLIFTRVCDTIGYANEMGIIHRDIKPDNIMLAPYGEYLVIDWGIAKDLNIRDPEDDKKMISSSFRYVPEEGEFGATLHGAVFGSPSYMSPEQARGDIDAIDARTDVFGLGALLFEMLTLTTPYEGDKPDEVVKLAAEREIQKISEIRGRRPDPRNPWPHLEGRVLPESVLAVAMKAMQANPDDRYQSAEELRSDIESYLSGHTTRAENAGLVKIIKLAVTRNKRIATALAVGSILAGTAVSFMASLNQKETEKARNAKIEAERYISRANQARAESLKTRLEVAPSYLEMARLLANRGEDKDALVIANLAAEYDPDLEDAVALVKALEIYSAIHNGTDPPETSAVGDRASLSYLLDNPGELKAEPGTHISEQTFARLEMAYSEVGLSHFSAQLSAEQPKRVDRYREDLRAAWKDYDLDWELSLAPELSALCLDEDLRSRFRDYSRWAAQIDRSYPGQVLHLEIREGSNIPDLSILANLAIESISIGKGTKITGAQLNALSKCRSLKVVNLKSGELPDLEFLKGADLVSLQVDNDSEEFDLSALQASENLQVLSTGKSRLSSLNSLPTDKLHIFSGHSADGDYSALYRMPLQVLDIRDGDSKTNLDSLMLLPVQTLIAEGIDLQKNWEILAAWPLKQLSIDSPFSVDVSALTKTMPEVTSLHVLDGNWSGDASRLFPGLQSLVDQNGRNFKSFTGIASLESILIEGNGDQVCYFSSIESMPMGKNPQFSHDLSIQVFPEPVALCMVKNEWEAAGRRFQRVFRKIQRRRDLAPAAVRANQLDAVIKNQDDPEECFLSRKYSQQGSVYQAVFCGLTKAGAEQFAREAGGALASIGSRRELDFLSEIPRSHPEYGAFWIGAYDPRTSRDISVSEGEALVLPTNGSDRKIRFISDLFPFIIEWDSDGKIPEEQR